MNFARLAIRSTVDRAHCQRFDSSLGATNSEGTPGALQISCSCRPLFLRIVKTQLDPLNPHPLFEIMLPPILAYFCRYDS